MANPLTLKDLLEALSGAVIGAQDRMEQHQLANLAGYFDDDNRPRSILVRLPSMTPGAEEGDEDFYRAPLLALVPVNPLQIREVEIDFDVQFGQIGDEPSDLAAGNTDEAGRTSWTSAAPRKTVQIDTRARMGQQDGAVHVRVKVQSTETSAGLAKLANQLTQTQGIVKAAASKRQP
jgi:hypothetical protein